MINFYGWRAKQNMVYISHKVVKETDFSSWLHGIHVLVYNLLLVKDKAILVSNNKVKTIKATDWQL